MRRKIPDRDELNALLEEVHAAIQHMKHVETHIKTMLGAGDVDVETDGVISEKQRRSKIIRGIVLELEKEQGGARVDDILQLAADVGIRQDEANLEIARLLRDGAIVESARGSGKYRLKE